MENDVWSADFCLFCSTMVDHWDQNCRGQHAAKEIFHTNSPKTGAVNRTNGDESVHLKEIIVLYLVVHTKSDGRTKKKKKQELDRVQTLHVFSPLLCEVVVLV